MVETSELDPRIRCERDRETHVARLTIDNPDRRNAYDPPMRRAMRAHLDEIATDDDIKVVILRGVEGVFSTGADMANSYAWYGNEPGNRRPGGGAGWAVGCRGRCRTTRTSWPCRHRC